MAWGAVSYNRKTDLVHVLVTWRLAGAGCLAWTLLPKLFNG